MAELAGSLSLDRAVLSEVTENPNTEKQVIVSGTSGGSGGNSPKTEQITQAGSLRMYGNGNVRAILGSGQTRQQTLSLRAISPSQLETVKALIGHTICYRDTYGRKIFGVFLDLSVQAIPYSGSALDDSLLYDAGLVIQSVAFDEEV